MLHVSKIISHVHTIHLACRGRSMSPYKAKRFILLVFRTYSTHIFKSNAKCVFYGIVHSKVLISAEIRRAGENPMYSVCVMSAGHRNVVWKVSFTKTRNSLPFFSSCDKTLIVSSKGLPKSFSWTSSSSRTTSFCHAPCQCELRMILLGGRGLKWNRMLLSSSLDCGGLSKKLMATPLQCIE